MAGYGELNQRREKIFRGEKHSNYEKGGMEVIPLNKSKALGAVAETKIECGNFPQKRPEAAGAARQFTSKDVHGVT